MRTSSLLTVLLMGCVLTGCSNARATPVARPVVRSFDPVAVTPVKPVATVKKERAAAPTPCATSVRACVDLKAHQAWLQSNGKVVYGPVPIASGPSGHATPRGTFDVLYKDQVHRSSTYGIAMPYSVFFAGHGIAFHEGPLDEHSHGCVHLSARAAPVFFQALRRGDVVQVR